MYNKKSKASAIIAIITAVLLVGFMILLPFLLYQQGEGDDLGNAIGAIVGLIYGYPLIYASAIPFAVVALVFGIKMLKRQERKKLIYYNVSMLITTCVLLPFLTVGLIIGSNLIFYSGLGMLPPICCAIVSLAYIAGLIIQIVTIVLLKKSPEENVPPVTEQ